MPSEDGGGGGTSLPRRPRPSFSSPVRATCGLEPSRSAPSLRGAVRRRQATQGSRTPSSATERVASPAPVPVSPPAGRAKLRETPHRPPKGVSPVIHTGNRLRCNQFVNPSIHAGLRLLAWRVLSSSREGIRTDATSRTGWRAALGGLPALGGYGGASCAPRGGSPRPFAAPCPSRRLVLHGAWPRWVIVRYKVRA